MTVPQYSRRGFRVNSIPESQNNLTNLERLASQRRIYSNSKTILGWQMILGGPVAVMAVALIALLPDTKGLVVFWSLAVAVADVAWLTPWQKRLRLSAARIQELFDCDVLELPWNALKAGPPPPPEQIAEASSRYFSKTQSMPALTDWYPPQVGEVPLPLARVICQRVNCWWDGSQRRRYVAATVLGLTTVALLVIGIAIPAGLTLDEFLARIAAPLLPALILGYRHAVEQNEAAIRLDGLRQHAEQLWRDALAGTSHLTLAQRSRILQDEIFDCRRRSPPVFDVVFRLLRHQHEAVATAAVAALVSQAHAKRAQEDARAR